MEQVLTPSKNGNFTNINLKTRYTRNADGTIALTDGKKTVLAQGLEDGNHIEVKKSKFASGREVVKPTYTFYSCLVEYKGEDVSFILYKPEHDLFQACGGIGDTIKITLNKEIKMNKKTGQENLVDVLSFELVDNA